MALMHYPLNEYLILDEMYAEFRLQYVEGDIFAMSGGSLAYSTIVNNLLDVLRTLSREYHTLMSGLRLATPSGLYTYPVLSVVRGELQLVPGVRDTVTNPALIIEIPSDWTAEFDRGKKFEHYSSIPALRDYLLIDQYTVDVEHRWRAGDRWQSAHYGKGQSFALTGIPLTIEVDAPYEDVTIPA